ncbi:hypothetical protein HPP92_013623 [Vanilla planifolia]|uniref:RIN4 pathogenic type III effector avirulence factor Avr cleavage site domain-containing protein n=1 Tax=Vanilla planifolia TaxID=51239 RepID=A0A835UWN4_VANPL|nr:hypothetical protein HPP92_013623 [Vanilla planifolia]
MAKSKLGNHEGVHTGHGVSKAKHHPMPKPFASPQHRINTIASGHEHSSERSPISDHFQVKAANKVGGFSPSRERKGSAEGGHASATNTPGRSMLRPEESFENGVVVPGFGLWDEGNPSSANGLTAIFDEVIKERQINATKVPMMVDDAIYLDKLQPVKDNNKSKAEASKLGNHQGIPTRHETAKPKDHHPSKPFASPQHGTTGTADGHEHRSEQSSRTRYLQVKGTNKVGGLSPSRERKGSAEGSRAAATNTPGRSKLRPEESKGVMVPELGLWDESDPSAADGLTDIFNEVSKERQTNATKVSMISDDAIYLNNFYPAKESRKFRSFCCFKLAWK